MVHVCTGERGRESRQPGGPVVGEAWLEPENHSAVQFWPETVPRFTATLPHAPASVWEAVGLPGRALWPGRRLEAPKTLTLAPQRRGCWVITSSWSPGSSSPSRLPVRGRDRMEGEVGKMPVCTSGHHFAKSFRTNLETEAGRVYVAV